MEDASDMLRVIEQIYESALAPSGVDALAGVLAAQLRTEGGFIALLPHVRRAIQVRHALALADLRQAAACAVFEGLGLGLIVLGRRSEVLYANPAASARLNGDTGLHLSSSRLTAARKEEQAALASAIENATRAGHEAAGAGGVVAVTGSTGDHLFLLISPLPLRDHQSGVSAPAALVILKAQRPSAPAAEPSLANALGITRAEYRLMAALAAGMSVAQYAEQQGIRMTTARTHLKRLLHKTGHHRQIDLMRTISSDPVLRIALQSSFAG